MGTSGRRGNEDDDYRFNPRFARRREQDPQRAPLFLTRLKVSVAKMGRERRGPGRTSSKRGRVAVRAPHERSRQCVIKAKYVALKGDGRKLARAHLAYLERDGVERDGAPGRLYGADEKFDAAEFREPLAGEPRQFRFIVSPQDADSLDLKVFTRDLMKQVEKDTGRSLIWAAVNHHNTDNPHVHIVVRGLDRDGDEVRIDGRYIGREMRWRAQEIITRELGPRLETELSRPRSQEIARMRVTPLDRAIERLRSDEATVSLPKLLAEPGREGRQCVARLRTLESLRLAQEVQPGVWQLAGGWMESLQDLGERQDVLDRLRPFVGDQAIGFGVIDEARPAPTVEGVVVGKGLDDELGGRMFVAIQTGRGEGAYVRVAPSVAESLKQGDGVRVGFAAEKWLKPADRIVARFAEENGGIYDPARHQRELEDLPGARVATAEPKPSERIAANVRRLERLERYQLVTRLPDGRWRIRPDLLSQLEDRERTHPQHRLVVERIGSDIARGSGRDSAAQELAELGRTVAAKLRLTYAGEPPVFKGRMIDLVVAPSGREYVRVVDHFRGQFILVPKPADWERVRGLTVDIARDRARLVITRTAGLSR